MPSDTVILCHDNGRDESTGGKISRKLISYSTNIQIFIIKHPGNFKVELRRHNSGLEQIVCSWMCK